MLAGAGRAVHALRRSYEEWERESTEIITDNEVFDRLLTKLEEQRQALGGKVFDVLGEAFSDRSLRELLIDAIRAEFGPRMKTVLLSMRAGMGSQISTVAVAGCGIGAICRMILAGPRDHFCGQGRGPEAPTHHHGDHRAIGPLRLGGAAFDPHPASRLVREAPAPTRWRLSPGLRPPAAARREEGYGCCERAAARDLEGHG